MTKTIQKIFNEDQRDRHDPVIRGNAELLTKNDVERRKILRKLIREKQLSSAKDYYLAAMILHHGPSVSDSVTAVKFSKISDEKGYGKARSLYAICLDRLLTKRGEKQKFGTQYQKKNATSKWKLLPVDPMTTDEERKAYNIAPLAELIENVERLNAGE